MWQVVNIFSSSLYSLFKWCLIDYKTGQRKRAANAARGQVNNNFQLFMLYFKHPDDISLGIGSEITQCNSRAMPHGLSGIHTGEGKYTKRGLVVKRADKMVAKWTLLTPGGYLRWAGLAQLCDRLYFCEAVNELSLRISAGDKERVLIWRAAWRGR